MAGAPGTGPGCLGSLAQAPSNSLAGVEGAPRRLGVSKPSWIVRTESIVRRERPKRPDPPCTICKGTGRINCRNCFGRGRINHADLVMLPNANGHNGVEFVVAVDWVTAYGAMERVNIENPWASTSLSKENEVALYARNVQCSWYQLRGHCWCQLQGHYSHSEHVSPVFQI